VGGVRSRDEGGGGVVASLIMAAVRVKARRVLRLDSKRTDGQGRSTQLSQMADSIVLTMTLTMTLTCGEAGTLVVVDNNRDERAETREERDVCAGVWD
jgi:hypothetical protein